MKRKSLLIMLLVALFVPLAMNAQEKMSKKRAVQSSQLERKFAEAMIPSRTVNVQNGMNKNNSVQISNLESRNFNTLTSSNAMSRGTRDVQYELVSSEQTDWSGNYIVGCDASTSVHAFDGDVYNTQSTYGSNIGGFTSVSQSSGTIADAGDAAILTFTAVDGADGWYTISVNGEYYLGSNPTEGLVGSSSLSSYDYFWTVYWYSNSNVPILLSYSDYDDDNAYGLTFFIGTDSDGSWGGFCTYELSDSSTEFEYYYAKLYKETSSSGGNTDCDYEKVTASQTDWSGDYVITYVNGTTARVLTGKASGGNYGDYTTATITDNTLANADVAAYNVTIAKDGNYYTLKIGDYYLGLTSDKNNLFFSTATPSAKTYRWTISYSSNTLKITNANYTNRYIQWNNTSGQYRFACYKSNSNMQNITLFKKLTDCEPATPCDAPTNLTTTDITNSTATLNWTGDLDGYSVRYRKGFVYDFESAEPWTYTNFAPCTTYDGDGGTTYGLNNYTFTNQYYVGACIAFQNGINNNMASHGGNAFGVMFNQDDGASNDWFILPEITVQNGDVFSFWTREITTNYGDEIINVGICGSTDGTFSSYLAQNVGISSTTWEEKSYDLSNYAGQTIKLAINCVSNDVFGLMIDDIFVGNPSESWSTPVAVTGTTYPLEGLDSNSDYTWQVQGNCDNTTTNWISAYFTTLNNIPVESITASDVTVDVNGTATISYTLDPTEPTDPTVSFSSANTGIATVDANGVVTGVTAGNTTITITANDGFGATTTINVTVNTVNVTGITANPTEINMITGETATISYEVAPSNATDPSVTITSSDETVATYDATTGEVTAVGPGTATITITSVSNPEVTATITVTVTSNPDAVQFTVNAPANAAPGDVITVEAVLTAPTNGTYEGFTDLLMRIYYDNTAFEFVANSMVYGPVATQAQQYGSQITPNTTFIANAIQLGINCYDEGVFVTEEGVVFSAQFTVLAETGEYTFTAQPKDELNFDHEGVAILYEATPSTVVVAALETYELPIVGYDDPDDQASSHGNGNYYLIASPIGEVAPADVEKMVVINNQGQHKGYDLYYFDHSQDLEWVTYKPNQGGTGTYGNPGFNLVSGKGYLYARKLTDTLVFTGRGCTSGEETITLAYTSGEGIDLPGWNLVGNPFAVNAFIANYDDERPFYTMDAGGFGFEPVTGNSIEAMQGIFVVAENEGDTVTFTTSEPTRNGKGLALNLSDGRNVIDRAIVRFNKGRQLPKLQFRKGSTMVYIPMEGQDYAVVRSEEMGEMPVSFKAENNGSYSLSLSTENVEFAYLHLIDNLTGNDVDLLETPSYSFEAKTTDYANRFKLVFATGNSTSDTFAFFSNGSFVINNEGDATLQVIDVTGRILKSESINGCANVNVNAASGVYMLRLVNGDNVKVQKVVVK